MNPIVADVCRSHGIDPLQFLGKVRSLDVVVARRDAIVRLTKMGLGPKKIALETGLHVQTVYYWSREERRSQVRKQSKVTFQIRHLGGPKQTKAQRQEIVDAYLADPAKGTALACSRGLHPLYAYKLANALGLLPLTRHVRPQEGLSA